MENLHSFQITYLCATNFKGSRVKIYSNRFKESVTISYDYSKNSVYEMAESYLTENGFNCLYLSETNTGYLILSDTFKPLKNK